MIKTRINNEYKDIIKIFGGGTLQKEITKIWSGEASKYVYESEVEYTGALPITITADGNALLDYKIYGNTVQNGTPTPDNPIQPQECGERTENLVNPAVRIIDANFTPEGRVYRYQAGQYDVGYFPIIQGNTYTIDSYVHAFYYTIPTIGSVAYDNQRVVGEYARPSSFTAPITGYCCFRVVYGDSFMANNGSTALPYEPYGYKIPMVSRTENLFDPNSVTTNERGESRVGVELPAGAYCITNLSNEVCYWRIGVETTSSKQINPSAPYVYINAKDTLVVWVGTNSNKNIMINLGSTAIPYEPYHRTVTNIYLGEVQTTRRIKKLVLTGEEGITQHSIVNNIVGARIPTPTVVAAGSPIICTHATNVSWANYYGFRTYAMVASNASAGNLIIYMSAPDSEHNTLSDIKSYLAAQYAAGTPVTVWYVLEEPETAVVNEALMKIGNYADTISMEQAGVSIPTVACTTVIDYDGAPKPSQMYIKYRR